MLKNAQATRISPRPQWRIHPASNDSSAITSVAAGDPSESRPSPNVANDFLRVVVDACVSSVAILDEWGNILYANEAWRTSQQAWAVDSECLETAPYYFESCKRLVESAAKDGAEISLHDDLEGILFGDEREFHRQYYCRSVDEQQPFVMHAVKLNLPGLSFKVLVTREETRQEVKQSKRSLTKLLETSRILAWDGEVQGLRFTNVSDQAVRMFGYPADTWCERDFLAAHIHPDDRERVIAAYHTETQVNEHFDLTFRMIAADGRVVWVQNLVSVTAENGTATQMHGFLIDISERKRSEESLKQLSMRLIAAQEDERKRVARELHDSLNQRMAILSIELGQLARSGQPRALFRKTIQKLQSQAQDISLDIHRLSYQLHPAKLDHLGLAAAVQSLCNELPPMPQGRPRVYFHQNGFPADIPKDVALCIFRIAQEGLRNCVKYSNAESAQVVLTRTEAVIRLSISDNGCGFDTESDVMEKGLGFISMKERLRIVGGQINISSQPLRGTRIDVSVPLNSEPRENAGGPLDNPEVSPVIG